VRQVEQVGKAGHPSVTPAAISLRRATASMNTPKVLAANKVSGLGGNQQALHRFRECQIFCVSAPVVRPLLA
jgi:hypothetical protein